MTEYEKRGYLTQNFRLFHPVDNIARDFTYHYHDFFKILIRIQGDVTYCVEGRSYELKPYDIVLVNPGEVHRPIVKTGQTYERIILYVAPEFLRNAPYGLSSAESLSLCFSRARQEKSHVLRLASRKSSRLFTVTRELENALSDTDYANELYQNVLFLEFMIHLNRAAVNDPLNFMTISGGDDRILRILSYINEHLAGDLSIDTLAEQFFTGKYYLMHSFKRETGYTLGNYVAMKRLRYARELIADGMAVTQACFECGFHSYSAFSRAYKKSFGEAPTTDGNK